MSDSEYIIVDPVDEDSCSETSPVATTTAPARRRVRQVVLFEYKQNDPKRDTGMKLARQGLVRSLRPGDPFKGIVLSAQGRSVLSPADAELITSAGIGAINCSWNRLDEITNTPGGNISRHRKLPFLIAANPINYGKAYKLSSAEALAAALAIVGFQHEAEMLSVKFSWHDEFWRLNTELISAYVQCNSSRDVISVQDIFLSEKISAGEKIPSSYIDIVDELDDEIDTVTTARNVTFNDFPLIKEFAKGSTISNPIVIVEEIAQEEIEIIPPQFPNEAPKDQKKCLLFLRDLPIGESLGLGKHVSGNMLAKMKRKEYLEIWSKFVSNNDNLKFVSSEFDLLVSNK